MLAELVHHVIGVDPDRDWITLAVVEAGSSGVVAEGRFAATGDGYDDAVDFVDRHSVETDRARVIEGSAGYGRGLAAALGRRGEWSSSSTARPARPKTARSPTLSTPSEPPARPSGGNG
jgi:transposase